MIYNPKKAIEEKILIPPIGVDISKNIQQNGIDIDCNKVFKLSDGPIYLSEDFKFNASSTELQLDLIFFNEKSFPGWILKKGESYPFESSFDIELPPNLGASLIGRSSFNRNGILIKSSWYDPGFKGKVGGTIYCFRDLIIKENTRIAQIIFQEGEGEGVYNGQYQKK